MEKYMQWNGSHNWGNFVTAIDVTKLTNKLIIGARYCCIKKKHKICDISLVLVGNKRTHNSWPQNIQ